MVFLPRPWVVFSHTAHFQDYLSPPSSVPYSIHNHHASPSYQSLSLSLLHCPDLRFVSSKLSLYMYTYTKLCAGFNSRFGHGHRLLTLSGYTCIAIFGRVIIKNSVFSDEVQKRLLKLCGDDLHSVLHVHTSYGDHGQWSRSNDVD